MSVFVSHDGDGTEVYVTTARGKVTGIEEKTSSVNIKIEAEYLQYPLGGWINQSEEALKIVREAYASGKEVEVRIEAQRKPSIDKSIPIQEIRDGKNAKTEIIKKLVAVDGVFTSEALTNPAEDPSTGQAKSALHLPPRNVEGQAQGGQSGGVALNKDAILETLKKLATTREVSESVIDAIKAQALIAGASPVEIIAATTVNDGTVPQQTSNAHFAKEAPAFKEHNSDGRLNLGGASVASGVGTYNYVFDKLSKKLATTPDAFTVEYFAMLTLAIADQIQTSVYGAGFKADRTVGSHTRVRSCVFTAIDFNEFPVNAEGAILSSVEVNEWVQRVGKTARHNMLTGIKTSQQLPTIKFMIEFLDRDVNATPVAEAPPVQEAQVPSEAPVSVPEPVAASQPVVEPVEVPKPVEAKPEPVKVEAEVKAEPVKEATPASTPDDGLVWYEQNPLPSGAINSSNSPTEATLEMFKGFVIDEAGVKTKTEQAKVSRLLAHTFGKTYNKASNIPEDDLADFLDFYVATGVDNFKAILASL